MHFAVQKESLNKTLKDITGAIATRVVQPILSNVLVESVDDTQVRFSATDLDVSVVAKCPSIVYAAGAITLPGKKLQEIVSKLPDDLVSFQVAPDAQEIIVSCRRSRFSMAYLSPDDFPSIVKEQKGDVVVTLPVDIFKKAMVQTVVAAAGYETGNILGGVHMTFDDGLFELAATDGSRLAHKVTQLRVAEAKNKNKSLKTKKGAEETLAEEESSSATATLEKPVQLKATVPVRACNEILKLLDSKDNSSVKIAVADSQIIFQTENLLISSRLIGGEYPSYHQLFPNEFTYLAKFNRQDALAAIDRVAVMSDDRTRLMKIHFEGDTMQLSANTPDIGKAQEEIAVNFDGQVLDLAVNVRYVMDVLQRLDGDDVQLDMSGALKPVVFHKPDDESYRYLLMPVQAR